MSDAELAYTSFDKPLRIITCNRVELMKDGSWHPTMKPMKLMAQIVNDYSQETDLIYDPFFGSGSTLMACKMLKRKFVGTEINKEYYEIAEKRINSISNTLF